MDAPDINRYVATMREIKRRTEVANHYLSGRRNALYVPTNVETIGLQFRKIFELIAFGSLAANRNQYSKVYKDFAKHWEASKLLKNLKRVNPDFYPRPIVEIPSKEPGVGRELKDREPDYLTQAELIRAHGECGKLLHAENPFGARIDYAYYQSQYSIWINKTINLLNNHKIHLFGDTGFWLIHMQEDGKGEDISWYRFDKLERLSEAAY